MTIFVHTRCVLRCDACLAEQVFLARESDVKRIAREQGWAIGTRYAGRQGLDICPGCLREEIEKKWQNS